MNLLFIGDVVGKSGCEFLRHKLYGIKKQYNIDITVVNGENSAVGNGINKTSLDHITASGADVITTGNHAFKSRDSQSIFNSTDYLIRPANYPDGVCGRYCHIIDMGMVRVAVINLMGVVFMEPLNNPFDTIDSILSTINTPNIFIDFHAEATAEKKAMAHYLSGRVTAIFGTHTHVQTSDECILQNHTAYITDVGMTGPENSVIGVRSDLAIEKQRKHIPIKFLESNEKSFLNGVIVEFDEESGKSTKIERIIVR